MIAFVEPDSPVRMGGGGGVLREQRNSCVTRSSVSFHTAKNTKVATISQQSPFKSPTKSHQKQNRNCVIGPLGPVYKEVG